MSIAVQYYSGATARVTLSRIAAAKACGIGSSPSFGLFPSTNHFPIVRVGVGAFEQK
jgi:hypothetical protein